MIVVLSLVCQFVPALNTAIRFPAENFLLALRIATEIGTTEPAMMRLHPDAVAALIALGRTDEAEQLTSELDESSRMLGLPWATAMAARCHGLLYAAAGDIACDSDDEAAAVAVGDTMQCQEQKTSALLQDPAIDAVLALGDDQYYSGDLDQFRTMYAQSWGTVFDKTYPVPGNHEYYGTDGLANGYFSYFGNRAGTAGKGWYSYDIGKWHLSSANGNAPSLLKPWGFDQSMHILPENGPGAGARNDPGIASRAVSWIQAQANTTKPWFLVVSLVNPHDVMFYPKDWNPAAIPSLAT